MSDTGAVTVRVDRKATPVEDLRKRPPFGSWKVLRFHGKRVREAQGRVIHTVELWTCKCRCGRESLVMRPNLLHGRSTQCQECARAAPDTAATVARRNMRTTWQRLTDLSPAWQSFETFWAWASRQDRKPHDKLCRKDATKLHGPTNSYFGRQAIKYEEALRTKRVAEGWTVAQVREWARGLTPQRVYKAAKDITRRQEQMQGAQC